MQLLWVLMCAVGGFSVTKLLSSHASINIMSKLIHSPYWTWVDQFSLFIYSLVIYFLNLFYTHAYRVLSEYSFFTSTQ